MTTAVLVSGLRLRAQACELRGETCAWTRLLSRPRAVPPESSVAARGQLNRRFKRVSDAVDSLAIVERMAVAAGGEAAAAMASDGVATATIAVQFDVTKQEPHSCHTAHRQISSVARAVTRHAAACNYNAPRYRLLKIATMLLPTIPDATLVLNLYS